MPYNQNDLAKARGILEEMPEDKFQTFFKSLPERVQLIVRGGLSDWKDVLPQYYLMSTNINHLL